MLVSSFDDRPADTYGQRTSYRDSGYRESGYRGSGYGDSGYSDSGYDNLMGGQSDTAVLERERGVDEAAAPAPWRLGWTSGADLGLLIVRVGVGLIFAAHGAQKVFGWWSGPGLDGFANNLTDLGFTQADVLSAATGFTELVGGVLLVLGLFTPLAGAALLAVTINAAWIKWGNGLFLVDGGYEAEVALGAVVAGLTMMGPGRIALDNGRFWFRHPVASGWFFLVAGVAGGILARLLFRGSL